MRISNFGMGVGIFGFGTLPRRGRAVAPFGIAGQAVPAVAGTIFLALRKEMSVLESLEYSVSGLFLEGGWRRRSPAVACWASDHWVAPGQISSLISPHYPRLLLGPV